MRRNKLPYQLRRKSARRSRTGSRSLIVLFVACSVVMVAAYALWSHDPWGWLSGNRQPASEDTASAPDFASEDILPVANTKAYGIAAGSSLTGLSDQALRIRLQAMAGLGVRWVRYDFDWSLIQPSGSASYNWTTYDRLVTASNRAHLQVLGILDYTPAWARPDGCGSSHCGPASAQQFATYAAAVVHRYRGQGVHTWEIWNEPNNKDFWQPAVNPTAYVTLLKQSYAAMKKQDHLAFILTGGLSPQATENGSYAPIDFLAAVYRYGGGPYFDSVADHPYTFPLSPTSSEDHAWNQMARPQNSLRAVMVANGDSSKKIWITEFGSPTGGPGPISTLQNPNLSQHPYKVDEALQAKILSDALTLYSGYTWAGPFFVYSLQDAGTDQSTNENFFGLLRYDTSQKPAYTVYKTAIRGGLQ